jgi:hypothetical protein
MTSMGRISEALLEMHRAHELDPLALPIVAIGGWIFVFARQYDQAIGQAIRRQPKGSLAVHATNGFCQFFEHIHLFRHARGPSTN